MAPPAPPPRPRLLRRAAPALLVGFGLVAMGQQWLMSRANQPVLPAVAVTAPVLPHGSACLQRDSVLAGLAARGIRAHPETPAFCVTPPGLTEWFALDPVGPDGTHLAFDINGCLQVWAPCEGTAP
jgi:hypothetical protein